MQRLLIPGCSLIWLFPSGDEALAFSHLRATPCFPADIGLQALFFLAHHIFNAVQTPSFLLVYSLAVLDMGWNTPCMVMSFLVPMSVSFRASRLQVTTAAGYRMAGTAKVLIVVVVLVIVAVVVVVVVLVIVAVVVPAKVAVAAVVAAVVVAGVVTVVAATEVAAAVKVVVLVIVVVIVVAKAAVVEVVTVVKLFTSPKLTAYYSINQAVVVTFSPQLNIQYI